MELGLRIRLSVMMFLTYVIWGAWLPLLAVYLGHSDIGFTGGQIGWIFATMAIASVTAMLISGQIADRWFATERFLCVSSLASAVCIYVVSLQTEFATFFAAFLVYTIIYVPILSLTNSISFANIKDAQQDFGGIRVWGTIGWIAASWPFLLILGDTPNVSELRWMFHVSAAVSVVLGVFSLTLPHTPPKKGSRDAFAPLEAIGLLAKPAFLVLFLVALSDGMVHQCYFIWTGRFLIDLGVSAKYVAPAMSIGQIAEIVTMFALGYFLKTLGWRKVMAMGVFAHTIRFGIYALCAGHPELAWLVIGSNLVHGAAYAFFFAAVYIYADEHAPKDVRASAQILFNLVILGLGQLFGSLVFGWLGDRFSTDGAINYRALFTVPAIWALVTGAFLLIAFWPGEKLPDENENGDSDSGLGDGEAEVEERLRDLGYVE